MDLCINFGELCCVVFDDIKQRLTKTENVYKCVILGELVRMCDACFRETTTSSERPLLRIDDVLSELTNSSTHMVFRGVHRVNKHMQHLNVYV